MIPLGTDFPVEGISPVATFYAAVVRKDKLGSPENGFQPENALTREEALRGITIWPAIANFEEKMKGSLEAGKWADLVMLDSDIITCSDKQILQAKPIMTVVQGEIVFGQNNP